jgi:hypothetical protein
MKKMEMIKCLKCEKDMPKLRLEKFGYKVCVDCSNISAYKAVNTTHGTGDHTWNDIAIMTEDQLKKLNNNKPSDYIDELEEN